MRTIEYDVHFWINIWSVSSKVPFSVFYFFHKNKVLTANGMHESKFMLRCSYQGQIIQECFSIFLILRFCYFYLITMPKHNLIYSKNIDLFFTATKSVDHIACSMSLYCYPRTKYNGLKKEIFYASIAELFFLAIKSAVYNAFCCFVATK